MSFKNKEQELKYRRAWYRRNKEKLTLKVSTRRNELRQWFRDYKATLSCVKCSESHIACLEFHHPNGEGTEVIRPGLLASRGWSKKRVLVALKKCIVLCANCHRKEHYPII